MEKPMQENNVTFCPWDESVANLTSLDPKHYYDPEHGCYCYDWCKAFYAVYPAFIAAVNIGKFAIPALLIIGTTSNCLIMFMFQQKELYDMPSRPLFQALAVTDIFVLLFCAFVDVLYYTVPVDITLWGTAGCKLFTYFAYCSLAMSTWMVALLSVDRFICVFVPLKANRIRKHHRIAVIVVITLLVMLSYVHMLVFVDKVNPLRCSFPFSGVSYYFYQYYFAWVDMIERAAAPFVVIILCNIGMFSKIRRRETDKIAKADKTEATQSDKLVRLVVMVNMVFLLSMLPNNILIIYAYRYPDSVNNQRNGTMFHLLFNVCKVCVYINSTVNFFIYCVSGSKFRAALKSLLHCKK